MLFPPWAQARAALSCCRCDVFHVACIRPLSSVTQLLPPCQGSSPCPLATACWGGVLVSPSVRISEARQWHLACPSHTAREDQSSLPRCDSMPHAHPTAPHQLPCAKSAPCEEDEIFLPPLFFEAHLELKSDWLAYPCKVKLLLLETQQAPRCGGGCHPSGDRKY